MGTPSTRSTKRALNRATLRKYVPRRMVDRNLPRGKGENSKPTSWMRHASIEAPMQSALHHCVSNLLRDLSAIVRKQSNPVPKARPPRRDIHLIGLSLSNSHGNNLDKWKKMFIACLFHWTPRKEDFFQPFHPFAYSRPALVTLFPSWPFYSASCCAPS